MRVSSLFRVMQELVNGGAKDAVHTVWVQGLSADVLWQKVRPTAASGEAGLDPGSPDG